ncbi:hypothetical protein XBKB1_4010023 [Xenorhabdus bovienii str. kraussei Becker Underwood]|uniref:Uncharacterized protein n=1 Tax=Xenorhabdus bovienii str. kraussei Becker Underwood TaxID=1398204 RepID=A0A077PM81_XENBV|nr:hypothetical protein XBKB1_4010023 [Xenorhabdus bovienii str. kraussei Becker Underwood]
MYRSVRGYGKGSHGLLTINFTVKYKALGNYAIGIINFNISLPTDYN